MYICLKSWKFKVVEIEINFSTSVYEYDIKFPQIIYTKLNFLHLCIAMTVGGISLATELHPCIAFERRLSGIAPPSPCKWQELGTGTNSS